MTASHQPSDHHVTNPDPSQVVPSSWRQRGPLQLAGDTDGANGNDWASELPVLRAMTRDELRGLFADLDPATDDVPWTFPVRSPLEELPSSGL